MTNTSIATQQAQAQELIGRISANPAIAAPFLEQLETAGDDPAKLKALTQAGLKAITAELPAAAAEEAVSLESRRDDLIEQFGIEVIGERKVRLTLGGTPRIEFLRKVQEVASELYGRPAICSEHLERWGADSAFTAKPENGGEIGVNGNVYGSTNKTRAEQEAKGWNNVDIADLAVAHAAYFLATGKDLFYDYVVRARGGALYFHIKGVLVFNEYDDDCDTWLAASEALPPRNQID